MLHLLSILAAEDSSAAADGLLGGLSALGAGGVVAFVFWRWHEKAEARHAEIEDRLLARLFDLADTGTKVAQQAQEVVREPDLRRQLERLEDAIDELRRDRR